MIHQDSTGYVITKKQTNTKTMSVVLIPANGAASATFADSVSKGCVRRPAEAMESEGRGLWDGEAVDTL